MLERHQPSSPALFAKRNTTLLSRRRAANIVATVVMCLALTLVVRNGHRLSVRVHNDKEPRGLLKSPQVDLAFDFDTAYIDAYDEVIADSKKSCIQDRTTDTSDCYVRKRVDFDNFPYKSRGGLSDSDRALIADLYFAAESVFEYGIGESTAIAAETNLPRYAGVDSSAEWITTARSHAPSRFRFSFADVGPTREWGQPESNKTLAKMALDYQLVPLKIERDAFDVYFVDGRWRVACVMASFLHAIQTGGDLNKIRVVLHDYKGRGGPEGSYGAVESIATIKKRSEKAVVLAKRHNATIADIFHMWRVSTKCCQLVHLIQCLYWTSNLLSLVSRDSGIGEHKNSVEE